MASVSKYALVFQNRLLSFDHDIDFIDIICVANNQKDLLRDENALFRHLNDRRHKSLAGISHTETSRKIIVNHLKNTVYSAYIKDVYEELTSYIKSLIYEAALLSKNASAARRLLGEHKYSIAAVDILQLDSIDALVMRIAEDIIQALENERSTKELIKKVCRKIGLSLDEATLETALPYLELRHKLVHTDGKVDEMFKRTYTMFTYEGDYVSLNHKTITSARAAITALVLSIDCTAISNGILQPNTP